MECKEEIKEFLAAHKIAANSSEIIIAISGGVDSVVLFHLFYQLGFSVHLAHVNFQLRGEESERDEAFVRSLSEKFKVPIHVKMFDTKTIAEAEKIGIQEAARNIRYTWFAEIVQEVQKKCKRKCYLATGHHADDNIETFLMNLCRGSGLQGLQAIKPLQERGYTIIRPLLLSHREAIENYATLNAIGYVHDSSNDDDKYTRNFFRKQVIPLLRLKFPNVENGLQQSIQHVIEIQQVYAPALQTIVKKLLVHKNDAIHIPVNKLLTFPFYTTLLYEIAKDYGFAPAQLKNIVELAKSATGKYLLSPTHRILKNRAWLIISPLREKDSSICVIDGVGEYAFAEGGLSIIQLDTPPPPKATNEEYIDAAQISFPMLLRPWQTGDYFYPLGMAKKKKVARFLIDKKLSKEEKDKVWVLESDKKIMAVLSHRIDNRFKVTEKTRKVFCLRVF